MENPPSYIETIVADMSLQQDSCRGTRRDDSPPPYPRPRQYTHFYLIIMILSFWLNLGFALLHFVLEPIDQFSWFHMLEIIMLLLHSVFIMINIRIQRFRWLSTLAIQTLWTSSRILISLTYYYTISTLALVNFIGILPNAISIFFLLLWEFCNM